MAQFGSASALGAEGRRFESGYPDHLILGDCPAVPGHARAFLVRVRVRTAYRQHHWSTRVKSAVENLTPTRVKLTVEIPAAEIKPHLERAYKSIGAQVQIPGFRKGKVPNRIIDQRFGRGSVVQEAVNEALPEVYTQALAENDLKPLGQPDINLTQLPMEDDQDLIFEAEVDIVPAFELPDFSGLEVTVDPAEVDEDAVSTQLESLRSRFGTLKAVERAAQEGDQATIDMSATIGEEEIDSVTGVAYEIGSGTMLEGMDEALTGKSAGETVTFTSPLAGGDHAGEDADITVVLQSLKERELPELDDEFAQLASPFDTLEELQEDLHKQAEQGARFQQGEIGRASCRERV